MSYQYDVFLSYKRRFPWGQWVDDIFFPLFVPYLANALNKEVSVFKDTENITSGSAWPQRLRNALAHSKCMVSILIPGYFHSEWCSKEFAVMHHRQTKLGYLTETNPCGLIIPIKLFDGEHFPHHVKNLQALDCREFNRIGDGVKHTQCYVDFQGVLQQWVYQVAEVVASAPTWNPEWISQKWSDVPVNDIQNADVSTMRKPNL